MVAGLADRAGGDSAGCWAEVSHWVAVKPGRRGLQLAVGSGL